jgi:hypothetical protein
VIGTEGPAKMNSSSEEAGRSSFVEEDKAGALRATATGAARELENAGAGEKQEESRRDDSVILNLEHLKHFLYLVAQDFKVVFKVFLRFKIKLK